MIFKSFKFQKMKFKDEDESLNIQLGNTLYHILKTVYLL